MMARRGIKLIFVLIFHVLTAGIANSADTEISGSISLPVDMPAFTESKRVSVRLKTDWNGSYFQSSKFCGSFTLPASQTTTTYQCTVSDTTGEIGVEVFGGNLEGVAEWNYYNSNGTTWSSQDAEHLVAGSIYANIDLALLKSISISGSFRTQPGVTFAEDKVFYITRAEQKTSPSGYTYWSAWWYTYTLNSGTESFDYSIDSPVAAGPVKIGYRWQETREPGFLAQGYFTAAGTVYEQNQATVLENDSSWTDIDMNLLEGIPLNGTIFLPDGATNSQDMTVGVIVQGDIYENQTITIQAGYNSADFTFSLPPGKQVKTSYGNVTGADYGYVTPGYYTANGTITEYWLAPSISTSVPPDNVELTLIPGITLSGTVSLPDGLTYPEIVQGSVYIYAGDSYLKSTSFNIPSGDSMATWSSVIPEGQRDLIAYTSLDLWNYDPGPEYLSSSYYNSLGTVGLKENAELIDGSTDQAYIDITLLQGSILSGTVSLESPELFQANGTLSLTAYWGTDWNSSAYSYPTIPVDTASVAYSITVPPDAPDYRLRYNQWAAPAAYVNQGYYDSSNYGYCESDADIFTSGIDHPGVDFTLLKGHTVEGTISLPDGDVEPENVALSLGTIFSPVGEYATTLVGNYRTGVEIPAGSNSTPYELPIPHSCSEISEEFRVDYRQDNENYVHFGFYNSSGTVGFMTDAETLAEGQSYLGKDIELIRGNEITGTISLPVDATVPVNGLPVTLGALQEPDGLYHTTVLIEQGMTSAPYSIRVAPDVGNTALGYRLPEETGFAPQGYYSILGLMPTNVTGQYGYAELFDPTILNSGNDFTLDYGNEISGTVYTHIEADHYVPIEITLAEDPADPATIYWHTVMNIRPGSNVTPYSRRIVLDSNIVAKFTNDDNTQWAPEGYYFDNTESVPLMTAATWLTVGIDHSAVDLFLSEMVAGDVNADGVVDLTDAVIILQIMTGMTISEDITVAGDVNGDGVLSFPEILNILNQL
ncbi:MAG: hypothetical protein GY702_10410 [Desulfobulbaceae bacterium]|nr:hypothetical protein [Desulfobulbaceae bacterium]